LIEDKKEVKETEVLDEIRKMKNRVGNPANKV
jgi:hypothetical protein